MNELFLYRGIIYFHGHKSKTLIVIRSDPQLIKIGNLFEYKKFLLQIDCWRKVKIEK